MIFRFDRFEFRIETGELRTADGTTRLEPQPARVLALLLERAGELVTREELQREIWPDRVVEYDQNLNYCVRRIRLALDDDADNPAFLETLPKRGYRFAAPVEQVGEEDAEAGEELRVFGLRNRAARVAIPVAAVIAVLVLFVVGYVRTGDGPAAGSSAAGRVTIAVLPFETLGGDSDQEHLAAGLTGELITELARLDPDRLGVIARTSAMAYAGSGKTIAEIAGELDADYVLEGSVRPGTERVRIAARLVRASDQTHVWAESYHRSRAELLTVQRDVGRRVVEELAPGLLAGGAPPEFADRRREPGDVDPEVREATLRGAHLVRRGEAARGLAILEDALEVAPDHVPALEAVGMAHLILGNATEARAVLERAISLDRSSADAHRLLAQVLLFRAWDRVGARWLVERAIQLAPGRSEAYQVHAYDLAMGGDLEAARQQMDLARRLDPVSASVNGDAGWIEHWAGDPGAAIERCRATLELEPENRSATTCVLFAAVAAGREAAAVSAAGDLMRQEDASEAERAALEEKGTVDAFWRWRASRLAAKPDRSSRESFDLGLARARLGEIDSAFEALEEAYRGRAFWMLFLGVEPLLEPLRGDPRFRDLLDRVGLPDVAVRSGVTPGGP